MGKGGPSPAAGNVSSSGEESSEDDWLLNDWSVNLYNALNPTVITTGMAWNTPTPPLPKELRLMPAYQASFTHDACGGNRQPALFQLQTKRGDTMLRSVLQVQVTII